MTVQRLHISIPRQRLIFYEGDKWLFESLISTAENGVGEKNGSGCTPRGKHIIRAKIGAGLSKNSVLVGRRPTGERYDKTLAATFPDRDWILTRILWLSGCELSHNRLGNVDTMRRYIYIHGSPDTVAMGKLGSHGCIRMRNDDIITLFDRVNLGASVMISETE
ncbi:MAG: L,D-transpeptidase [Gammaproteobacteria bacterium]|nr:L,D-transpeptidase [Gammaproteobacteria bacterium]